MTPDLTTDLIPAGRDAAQAAARVLARGGLVAFPTETVYGLGADATDARAVARLYAAKGRPAFNPLIAHVNDLDTARRIARFDARSLRLAEAFWPGPLTLVLPKAAGFLGMSVEVLQEHYGHHHPDYMQGAATAITAKTRHVSVVETVVSLESAREKRQKAQ